MKELNVRSVARRPTNIKDVAKLFTLDVCEKLGYAFKCYIWKKRRGKKKEKLFHTEKRKKNLYVFTNAARHV